MQRLLLITAGLILLALGTATLWLSAGRDRVPDRQNGPPVSIQFAQPAPAAQADSGQVSSAAADEHRLILGTWQDDYHGRRTMTVRDDGTATMVCELEGMNARLFTPVLNLNLRWQLADGVMTRVIIDGTPTDKVKFVVNLMGARTDEKLLRLTETELHLLDPDGQTEYHWTRVAALEAASSSETTAISAR
jgi:hypothetical protein